MKWLALLLAALGIAIVGFNLAYPSVSVRYRLTLNAEVDGKPVSGSSVVQVLYETGIPFATESAANIRVEGEAVVLDLAGKGTLFALLKAGQDERSIPQTIVLRAFNFPGGALPSPVSDGVRQIGRLSGKVNLPLANLPMLVRFRDLNDPLTVERVDPTNLETTFGRGVKLTSAALEIVSADTWPARWFQALRSSPTKVVSTKLGWLPKYYDRRLDGQRFGTTESSTPFANSLSSGAFSTRSPY